MSQLAVNAVTDANGGNTATINSMTPTADSLQGFRNRIINGDMRIDQRNAGASVTPTNGQYTLDRWRYQASQASKATIQQDAGSVTPPSGFTNYLGITSSSAYTVGSSELFTINHPIEGFNVSDLGWGTANAKTVTASFWIRSSLTGTFGGAVGNGAGNRSYPFSYTISSANTWEQKSITVIGDTTGTWDKNNSTGLILYFGLGVGSTFSGTAGAWAGAYYASATGAVNVLGTLNATWYVTGVQLEVGSVATPFERRPYGTELALCQRYYYKIFPNSGNKMLGFGYNTTTTVASVSGFFPVTMRTRPTALEQSGTAADYAMAFLATGANCSSVPTFDSPTTADIYNVLFTVASGLTAGQGSQGRTSANTTGFLAWSAEL
jgi:hypothetical protein